MNFSQSSEVSSVDVRTAQHLPKTNLQQVALGTAFHLERLISISTPGKPIATVSQIRLTALEMKLLRYLIEHEGLVLSRTELLKNVWGMDRAPATRTVDTFMLNLRKLFEENPSQPRHFLSVRGAGYRFISDSTQNLEN